MSQLRGYDSTITTVKMKASQSWQRFGTSKRKTPIGVVSPA
jgi:hypothetical protein